MQLSRQRQQPNSYKCIIVFLWTLLNCHIANKYMHLLYTLFCIYYYVFYISYLKMTTVGAMIASQLPI